MNHPSTTQRDVTPDDATLLDAAFDALARGDRAPLARIDPANYALRYRHADPPRPNSAPGND